MTTLSSVQIKPAACLDWDGTIRYSKAGEFINKPEDIALFPDVEAVLWGLRDEDYLVVGLTNQGGVAYGLRSEADVVHEIAVTRRLFGRDPFHIVQCCLMHPKGKVEPWNHRSLARKPDYGMLVLAELEAQIRYRVVIDWDRSVMVGDRPEDQECARRAGIEFQWAWQFFGRAEPKAATVE